RSDTGVAAGAEPDLRGAARSDRPGQRGVDGADRGLDVALTALERVDRTGVVADRAVVAHADVGVCTAVDRHLDHAAVVVAAAVELEAPAVIELYIDRAAAID